MIDGTQLRELSLNSRNYAQLVLLVPGATPSKLGLKLIDYDGMWVPSLADKHSGEVGHPNFQHPLRLQERLYNADVDRFPHLVIGCALRATLVGGKSFWEKFDNGDNLLFREQDLQDPSKSPVFKALWGLQDELVRTLVGHIALSSKQPLRMTPWLDDLLVEDGTGVKLGSGCGVCVANCARASAISASSLSGGGMYSSSLLPHGKP